jgi:hypothetical protein
MSTHDCCAPIPASAYAKGISARPDQEPPHPNPLPRQSRGRGGRSGGATGHGSPALPLFGSRNRAAVAHRVRATMARCSTRGPLRGGESGSTGRVAGIGMDAGVRTTQEQLSESGRKARPRLTDLPGTMPGKRQAGWPFSLVIFLFTPGILPFALRASFAVRARTLRARGHAKRK